MSIMRIKILKLQYIYFGVIISSNQKLVIAFFSLLKCVFLFICLWRDRNSYKTNTKISAIECCCLWSVRWALFHLWENFEARWLIFQFCSYQQNRGLLKLFMFFSCLFLLVSGFFFNLPLCDNSWMHLYYL